MLSAKIFTCATLNIVSKTTARWNSIIETGSRSPAVHRFTLITLIPMQKKKTLNLNQWESLRFSKTHWFQVNTAPLNFSVVTWLSRYTDWNSVNFHWISDTFTDSKVFWYSLKTSRRKDSRSRIFKAYKPQEKRNIYLKRNWRNIQKPRVRIGENSPANGRKLRIRSLQRLVHCVKRRGPINNQDPTNKHK